MQTASRIRAHLSEVAHLYTQVSDPEMMAARTAVKQLQSRRFRATYADFLGSPTHGAATHFFLEELYGKSDFAERDAQFGQIAGAIERLFPAAVGELAVDLAEIHALSERLDHTMAEQWLVFGAETSDAERYVRSWRATNQRGQRMRQLAVVLHMGRELQRLTRVKSLLVALKMMRQPAHLAGLASLQQLLERGFAAFAAMGDAKSFLTAIESRESAWIADMFDMNPVKCTQQLTIDLLKVQNNH